MALRIVVSLFLSIQCILASGHVAVDSLFADREATKDVIVVGSVNADLVFDIQRLPLPGETIAGGGGVVLPGGKGANQAVAAAALGANVKFAGVFGNDNHADMLRATMKSRGVDLDLSLTHNGPNGQAVILLQEGGENSIVLVPGANAVWPDELPAPLADAIENAGAVLLQREIPNEVNIMVAKRAHAAGVPVILDMGGEDTPCPDDLLSSVDYLCPNESELSRMTGGMPTDDIESITKAVHTIQKKGVKNVLVTVGVDGSLLFRGDEEPIQQPIFSVPKVVDTTGAGDCFRGSFAASLAMGLTPSEGMMVGSAASALSVQIKGAMNSMPAREDTLQFIKSSA